MAKNRVTIRDVAAHAGVSQRVPLYTRAVLECYEQGKVNYRDAIVVNIESRPPREVKVEPAGAKR